MQSNFPKTSLFFSAIFFCFCLAAFFFFFKYVDNGNKELQSREVEWQTESMRREGIKQLDHSVQVIEGERAELDNHFAESSDVVPFLDTMEKIATQVSTKAEITSVDVLDDHSGLYVGMKASGTFSNVYKFLKLLENSPYEVELMVVDMHKEAASGPADKQVSNSNWNVSVKMKLLSFIP